ncbi:MAG: hypothetical protein MJB12_06575 [Firmicutes bacterium]|nr:hypothetical protein [Bacillota bacterium]
MDDIVQKIIEIELQAQHIIDETEQEKQRINEALASEIEAMRLEIERKVERKLKQIKEREMQEAYQKVDEVQAKTQQQLEAMVECADNKKQEWEKYLMDQIVGW